jgi:hypothetical protein
MESQKKHTYIVQGETFVICCWAYKVVTNLIAYERKRIYGGAKPTLQPPFPPHPHSSQIKCKIDIPSSILLLWFCFFLEHKIIKTTYPLPHIFTHIHSSQSEMKNSYSRCPFFFIIILLYCWE